MYKRQIFNQGLGFMQNIKGGIFLLNGLGKKDKESIEYRANVVNTKQESSSTTETGSADELNEKRNDLYQQENQLFVDQRCMGQSLWSYEQERCR